ncbi:unnamed protein product [Lactuca saligna]|uniref:RPW8 domain-containing protein n=1 Tax=Lactuca saligna TaxID=75948 RepID=A0AA36A4B0_LACSI|nr:unnamed protein product [Lactuca saligna]
MAGVLLLGAGLGAAVSKLSDVIIHVLRKSSQFRSELTQIQETITTIRPMIENLQNQTKVSDRLKHEHGLFITQIVGAEALILKCNHVRWFEIYTHAVKLDKLNVSMLKFFQIVVPLVILNRIGDLQESITKGDSSRSSSGVPLLNDSVIGFEDQVRKLKEMVLKDSVGDECSVVVVSAPGGCGKTTLVKTLCHDPDIQAKFDKNVYFVTISERPNLQIVIKDLLGNKEADFINDADAINKWGSFLNGNESEILLVLDDVWDASIINSFKFKFHKYKILATSRTIFTQFNTYELQLLNDHDAAKLFSYYAVSEHQNEDIPDDLVDKLLKSLKYSKKHPLTLSVIGGLLKGKPVVSWRVMLKKLSDGQQSILDLHQSIEHCLARSLDALEKESEMKKCYLDLGLFPEDKRISATMLMDMWVHLYNHEEDGSTTLERLLELSYRNLATILRINSPKIAND